MYMTKNSYYNNAVAKTPNVEGILGKTLPAHSDAERAVLGALLLNDEYISTISEIIVPDDFYSPAHKTIYQAIIDLGQKHKRIDIVTLQDELLKRTFQHLSDIKSHTKGITGIPSGFQLLDQMTSGFQNSDFIVLAARPSMGKTALAMSVALTAARNGFATGIFSLEMSAEQLTLRLLSAESGIGHHNIRNATISSDEWIDLTNVAAQLAEMKVFIDDTAMLNIMDLRAKARKLK